MCSFSFGSFSNDISDVNSLGKELTSHGCVLSYLDLSQNMINNDGIIV